MKIIHDNNGLSTLDGIAITELLPMWQKMSLAVAPFMTEKYVDDLLKQNLPNVNTWLSQRGYQYEPINKTASTTTATTTGIKSGGLVQVPNLRGGTVNRYAFIDDNGDIWGLLTKDDLATADYLKEGDSWTYVTTDPTTNKIVSPTKAGQYYDPIYGQWKPLESTDPFAGLGGTGTLTPEQEANIANTEADTAYRNALTQQLLQEMNNPASTDAERSNAAMQLYGILADFMASSNATNVNQWGNQAAAFNQAYGNAIEQNKWLQEMQSQPINTVAYLNLIRGENPPNWQIPNFQKMPDAFQGWQQPQPTQQSMPSTEQVMQILQGLGWGQQQPQAAPPPAPPTNWGNVPSPVGSQQFQVPASSPNQSWAMNTMSNQLGTVGNVVRNTDTSKLTNLQQQIQATQSALAKTPTTSPTYNAYTAQLRNLETAYRALGGA